MQIRPKLPTRRPTAGPQAGLWRIEGGSVVAVDANWRGPTTVLVPSEAILVTLADLPFASRRKRAEMAAFAVEGVIAEPLDRVHVALGQEVAERRHLCAVVRHDLMREWISTTAAAGLDEAILLPDALALSRPPEGTWRVVLKQERALVRTPDGAGFAVDRVALTSAWKAAGEPRLLAQGDPLPEALGESLAEESLLLDDGIQSRLMIPPVDLRQPPYGMTRQKNVSPWRSVGVLVGLGAAAHLAIAVLDTLMLHYLADRREAELRATVSAVAPDLATMPLSTAVETLTSRGGASGSAIGDLTRIGTALAGQPWVYRAIDRSNGGPTTLSITARDASTLEAGMAALAQAAIPARSALEPQAAGLGTATGVNARVELGAMEVEP